MGLQCMLIQCYSANQCMVIQCYSALQATWQYEGLIILTQKKFIDLNYFERTCALVQWLILKAHMTSPAHSKL